MRSVKVLAFLGLLGIVISVFLLSLSTNFLFFVDSKTYVSRRVYEYFVTESSYIHPFSTMLLAFLNCYFIIKLGIKKPILTFLFFMSPYQILLITNLTKESIFFAAIVLFAILSIKKPKALISKLPFVAFISRPIYFLFYYITPRGIPILILGVLAVYLAIPELLEKFMSEIVRRTEDRHLVTHNNGRDFFNYYCVSEKSNILEMIKCLIPGLFFVPNQPSYGIVEYMVFFTFNLSIWVVVAGLWLRRMFYMSFTFILGYFVIFLMAPTFGSFVRYYYPQIWLFGAAAYLLPTKKEIKRKLYEIRDYSWRRKLVKKN